MNFKSWFEAATTLDARTDAFFGQRDKIQKKDIGKLLGFNVPLQKINQGSLATIYQHPTNPNWIIKVTSHRDDVNNLTKAQRLGSPNIVKIFGKPQPVPQNPRSYWMIVQKVNGQPMVYDTNSFIGLISGDHHEEASDAATSILYPDGIRSQILQRFNKNTEAECEKLSSLFETLHRLGQMGIEMSDFGQNIIDDGQRYVIIDLGF